ncbi:unnamed protein product, partial [Didymodactylos carnosus]
MYVTLTFLSLFSLCLSKVTYFNLETTYGPYCNGTTYEFEGGIIRYAGTPWTGVCELRLKSCCLPPLSYNVANVLSTRFYFKLTKPLLCTIENVTIITQLNEKLYIDCNTTLDSEYFFDADNVTIIYQRTSKLPISKFTMIVTPLKLKQ